MPYPRVKAYSEEEFFRGEHPGHNSVCQKNRDVYREVSYLADKYNINQEEKERVLYLLRLMMAMQKKMHERLKYYKNKYEPQREDKIL